MSYGYTDYRTGDRAYTRYGNGGYHGQMIGEPNRWRRERGDHLVRDVAGYAQPPPIEPAVIKKSDMEEYLQQSAVDLATSAMQRFKHEKDMAEFIKKEFDLKWGPAWHVIVSAAGSRYAAKVAHSDGFFTYFDIGDYRFLMFRTPN